MLDETGFKGCILIGENATPTADNQLVIALRPETDNQIRTVIEDANHRALIDRYVRKAVRESENTNIIVKE